MGREYEGGVRMIDLPPPTFINTDKPFNLSQPQYHLIPELGVIFTFCFVSLHRVWCPDRELLPYELKLHDGQR